MEIGNMTSIIILSRSPVLRQLIAKLGFHFFIITNIAVNNFPFYSRFRTKVGVFYCGSEKVTPKLKKRLVGGSTQRGQDSFLIEKFLRKNVKTFRTKKRLKVR